MDARGASTNYTYNSRALVEQISYGVPTGSQIPAAPTVNFTYDDLGNRTQMTDGLGTINYAYNESSQMTAETRFFTDTLANAPLTNNGFKLEYTYTTTGQLSSLKDPYGQKFNYGYDKAGRLQQVTGTTAFNGITNYASNPHYRAWGGLQSLSYGNGTQMNMTFNNRLQANHFELNDASSQAIMKKDYEYYADGNLRKLDDLVPHINNADKFDRLMTYDHAGRIKTGKSGLEAHGGTVAQNYMKFDLPYRQSYEFNAFNNMTQRQSMLWGEDYWNGSFNINRTYQNNRVTSGYWQYDADGRVLAGDNNSQSTFDSAGQLATYATGNETSVVRSYDGDGREAKRNESNFVDNANGGSWVGKTRYYIRSSILGNETVSEADETGRKLKTNVYAAGTILAVQNLYHDSANNTTTETVRFENSDASGLSYRSTLANGTLLTAESKEGAPAELDPLGGNVGLVTHFFQFTTTPKQFPGQNPTFPGGEHHVQPFSPVFELDGLEISAEEARAAIAGGRAMPAEVAQHRNDVSFKYENVGFGRYRGTWDRGYDSPGWMIEEDEKGNVTGKTWSKTAIANTVTGSYTFSIPNSWSPSQQTRQQKSQKPVPFKDIAGMRGELQRRLNLNNGECRKKLNELLKTLGKEFKNKKLNLTGFDALAEKFLSSKKKLLESMEGDSNYNPFTKYLTMNINPTRGIPKVPILETIGIEFIHEVIHGAEESGFLHEDIVRAISGIEGVNFAKLEAGQRAEDLANGNKNPNDSALFEAPFNSWLQKYCGGNGTQWDKFYQSYK